MSAPLNFLHYFIFTQNLKNTLTIFIYIESIRFFNVSASKSSISFFLGLSFSIFVLFLISEFIVFFSFSIFLILLASVTSVFLLIVFLFEVVSTTDFFLFSLGFSLFNFCSVLTVFACANFHSAVY